MGIGQEGTASFETVIMVTLQVEIMYIEEPCKIICNVIKYYSQTIADGKTFILAFYVLRITVHCLSTRRRRLG